MPQNRRRRAIGLVAVVALASLVFLACPMATEETAEETATPDVVRPQGAENVDLTAAPPPPEGEEAQCPNPYPSLALPEDAQPPFRITPAATVEPPSPYEPLPFERDEALEELLRERWGRNWVTTGHRQEHRRRQQRRRQRRQGFRRGEPVQGGGDHEVFHQQAAGPISLDSEARRDALLQRFDLAASDDALSVSSPWRERSSSDDSSER